MEALRESVRRVAHVGCDRRTGESWGSERSCAGNSSSPDGRTLRAVQRGGHGDRSLVPGPRDLHEVDARPRSTSCHEGVAFIFNTPNEKSRPGYLKMGWRSRSDVSRSGDAGRDRCTPRSTPRGAGAGRAMALPTTAGEEPVVGVRRRATPRPSSSTPSRPAQPARRLAAAHYLTWRYGYEALGYRVVSSGSSASSGLAVFAAAAGTAPWRRRACDVLVPEDDARLRGRLLRRVRRGSRCRLPHGARRPTRSRPARSSGCRASVRRSRTRARGRNPRVDVHDWSLTLGDVELF